MGKQVKFCSLGLGGNSMEYGGGCTRSGYLHSVEEVAKHYAHELTEGVLLLDKRPVLEEQPGCAFASPMVNVDMQEGDVDRFMERLSSSDHIVLDMLKEYSGYGGVIQAAEVASEIGAEYGPLDYVPIPVYVDWWVSRGAALYRWDGEQFVQVR